MRFALISFALILAPMAHAADQAANGGFDDGMTGWWVTQNLAPDVADGRLCAEVAGGLTNPWDAIVGQDNVALEKGEAYTLSFHASGDPKGPVRALVQENHAPWTAYVETVPQTTPAGEDYEIQFRSLVDNPKAQIVFQVGGAATGWTLCLDNIRLMGGGEIKAYHPDTGSPIRVNQLGYLPTGPKRATWVVGERSRRAGPSAARTERSCQGQDAGAGRRPGFRAEGPPDRLFGRDRDRRRIRAGRRRQAVGAFRDPRRAVRFAPRRRTWLLLPRALGHRDRRGAGRSGLCAAGGSCRHRPEHRRHVGPMPDRPRQRNRLRCALDLRLHARRRGGWYDAGDHGKYVVNGGISVAQLMSAYERDARRLRRWRHGDSRGRQRNSRHPGRGAVGTRLPDEDAGAGGQAAGRDGAPQGPRQRMDRPAAAAASRRQAARTAPALDRGDAEPCRRRCAGVAAVPGLRRRLCRRCWTPRPAPSTPSMPIPTLLAPAADGNSGGGPYDDDDTSGRDLSGRRPSCT